MSQPDTSPAPPAIRSPAERIERAFCLTPVINDEDQDLIYQMLADRARIDKLYDLAMVKRGQEPGHENPMSEARLSWLCSILSEALGGEGRGGEQEGEGKGTNDGS